jgi:hypothetical protein
MQKKTLLTGIIAGAIVAAMAVASPPGAGSAAVKVASLDRAAAFALASAD